MRKRLLAMLPAMLAPTFVGGCQTWGPTWSEVTGERYNVTIMNRRPAIIDRVDDRAAFPSPRLIKVEPGEHRLVVQGPAPKWIGGASLHEMTLAIEPCKRYYINAQFDNPVTPTWTPVVDYVEPIAGCLLPPGA